MTTSGECELTRFAQAAYVPWCIQAPCSRTKDFEPLAEAGTNLSTREDERLSWPEYLRVNNLLKVITRRPSGAAGIRTCELQIQKPTR